MAQHDYVIANASGASVRADINNMALAISSNNSGSSEPSTKYAYLWWLDSSANVLKLRNSANNAWITMPFSITANNTVDINGGAIDGTPIGASAASTGVFTTFTSNGIDDNADATAITIDSSEKVGIGETTPLGKLHVKNADSGVTSPDAGFDDFIVENSTDVGMSLLSTDTATIAFNDANGAPDGSIQYRHDDRSTRFTNSGAERMRIDSSGVTSITKAGSLFTPLSSDGLVIQHSDATGIRIIDSGNAGNNGGHVGIGNDNGNLQLSTAGVMLFDTGFQPTDQLYNGRHERMRIDSSGNVGIGTTSPDSVLHIKDSGDTYVTLEGGASDANVGFNFQNSGGTQKGYILYDTDDNQLFGQINNSEAFRFKTGSNLNECMSIGGVTPRADIALTQQGHGENWATGAHTTNGYLYMITSAHAGVYMIPGQSTWTANSDERIKENITSLGTILPEIANIRCVKFNLKGQSETRVGFIAQDWESKSFSEVLNENDGFVVEADGSVKPKADSDSTDKVKGIAYTETIPVLLKAIQEQQAIIEDLKTRIETLEG